MNSLSHGSDHNDDTAATEFYGLRIGDEVCVHGRGFGQIVDMHESEYPSGDRVTVKIERQERHAASGQTIRWTETFHPHPRNVSLPARVAQERWEARSAAS